MRSLVKTSGKMSSDAKKKGPMRFEGKTALITGAAGDLGKCTAQLFSEEGARLILFDLSSKELKLKHLVVELSSLGSPAVVYFCGDVSNIEDVKKAVQRGVKECGGIDILFNCAGIISPSVPLQSADEATFKTVLDVNVYGVFLMMKYVSNQMIEAGNEGVIVNMSSMAGLVGTGNMFAYCASKFAVSGMTRAAAKSLAEHKIRVCAVAPGIVEGSMADTLWDSLADNIIKGERYFLYNKTDQEKWLSV